MLEIRDGFGRVGRVRFRHHVADDLSLPRGKNSRLATKCILLLNLKDAGVQKWSIAAVGHAWIHKKDEGRFCKRIGRKASFARMLQLICLSREARKVAWQAYFKAMPGDKKK